jgi:hypothetical protein
MDWPSFWEGAAAGGIAASIAIKVVVTVRRTKRIDVRSTTDTSVRDVRQQGNRVGGDLAGRDINKRV